MHEKLKRRNLRIPRATGTSWMPATLAVLCLALEKRVALVAGPAHPMHRMPSYRISLTLSPRKTQRLALSALIISRVDEQVPQSSIFRNGLISCTSPLYRVPWTLLTTRVATGGAELFCTKGVLAAVALAVDTHHNTLLDPLGAVGASCGKRRGGPLGGFEGHAIFCEEGAGLLLAKAEIGSGAVNNNRGGRGRWGSTTS